MKAFHVLRTPIYSHRACIHLASLLPDTARYQLGFESGHAVTRYKDHWASMTRDKTFPSQACIADPVRGCQNNKPVSRDAPSSSRILLVDHHCRIFGRRQSGLAHQLEGHRHSQEATPGPLTPLREGGKGIDSGLPGCPRVWIPRSAPASHCRVFNRVLVAEQLLGDWLPFAYKTKKNPSVTNKNQCGACTTS